MITKLENWFDRKLQKFIQPMGHDVRDTIITFVVSERARLKRLFSFGTIKNLLFGLIMLALAWGITWLDGGKPVFAVSEDWSFSNYVLLSGMSLTFAFFMATYLQRDDSYGNLMFNNGSVQGISANGNKSVLLYVFSLLVLGALAFVQVGVLDRSLGLLNLLSLVILFVPLFMGDTLSSNARHEGTKITNLLLWLVACGYLLVH